MRERKTGRRAESFRAQNLLHKVIVVYKALTEPYILLKTREITKMYEQPKIHRG